MQKTYPLNYRIHLEPDLVNFKFEGHCEILFQAPESTDELTVNILEIALWSCRVLQNDDFVDCAFKVNPAKEEVRICLPEPMSGNIRLKFDYQGLINDKMIYQYCFAWSARNFCEFFSSREHIDQR